MTKFGRPKKVVGYRTTDGKFFEGKGAKAVAEKAQAEINKKAMYNDLVGRIVKALNIGPEHDTDDQIASTEFCDTFTDILGVDLDPYDPYMVAKYIADIVLSCPGAFMEITETIKSFPLDKVAQNKIWIPRTQMWICPSE